MAQPPPASPLRSMHFFEWAKLAPQAGLPLVPALLIILALGVAFDQPAAAAIATAGAFTTGFGAFQQFTRSRFGPMLFAAVGIALSTLIGGEAGKSTPVLLMLALVYGLWCGLLPAIGMGAFWIGQQFGVFLIVSSAYGDAGHILERMLLVGSGGALQIVCYMLVLGLARGRRPRPSLRRMLADAVTAFSGLRFHLRLSSPRFQFAVRFALVLFAAASIERSLRMQNGYWIAMTALLLTRPDFQDTLVRGLGRVAGTLAGAVLATLITHLYVPATPALAALVALFAACSYVSVRAHYGLFSFFLTAYVVFLLVLAGLAEPQVAFSRAVATAVGASLALLAHIDLLRLRRVLPIFRSRAAPPRA